GGFGLQIDGSSRALGVPRRLAGILAILAIHGGRGVARDRLLHLLWSDADPDRARHALTQSLYALRRLLGVDDAILGTAQLTLNTERVATDVARFERGLAASDPTEVLEAHRGALLEGFAVTGAPELERWIEEQRAQVTQRLVAYLDAVARAMQAEGRHADSAAVLRRRAALDPLDATGALALMRAWSAAGDTPAAVQHARVYGELVRQELDLEPDPRVDDLAIELQRVARETRAPSHATFVGIPVAIPGLSAVRTTWRELTTAARRAAREDADWVLARWRQRSPRWRTLVWRGATVSMGLVVAMLAVARWGRNRRAAETAPTATAVLPFRATGISGDLAFLPAGMVDLLSAALSERDTVPVIDPERVHRWWQSSQRGATVPSSDSLLQLTGALGARRLVTGTLVGNASQIVIRANFLDQSSRRVLGKAVVNGALDSLPRLINRVATLLLAGAAGVGEELSYTPDVDPRALRAYLRGRAAYARADFRAAQGSFATALAQDSTLASASIGLALTSDWLEDQGVRMTALDVARRGRRNLPNLQQQQIIALQGPRFPEPSSAEEHFAAWERVARTGDRAELWADLGRRLLLDGRLAGVGDAEQRAQRAFARALELDSTNSATRLSLAALSASDDEAGVAVDQIEGDVSDLSLWAAWRVAARSKDARVLERLRAGFDVASDDLLRRIALAALSDGDRLADGQRALSLRTRRAQTTSARIDAIMAEHAYALNGGSPSRALAATRRLEDLVPNGAHLRLRILDALYGDGDSTAASEAVDRLTHRMDRSLLGGDDERTTGLADLCVLEQWRVWRGDFSTVGTAIRVLIRDPGGQGSTPVTSGSATCGYLLEALGAGLQGTPRAGEALARAERLALSGPAVGDLRQYATLALARVRERRGEFPRAYELVYRRSETRGWPRYLTTYLKLEAALAERLADPARARLALRHYIGLRATPDSSGVAELERARELLRRLEGQA
ncbi:MAG: BTAD domain-containing putative transcriptional regulator, partial [Gemmatimonadaceae bacterium]